MLDFSKVENMIIKALQTELIGQGHKATGELINTIEGRTMQLPDSVVIEILMQDYSRYVNNGRKAGAKKVPISVLVDWIERKGIASGDKDIKNMAFAIQMKIFKEGSPTQDSFQFSNNGRRAGFIDFVILNEINPIVEALGREVFKNVDNIVTDIVQDYNKDNK